MRSAFALLLCLLVGALGLPPRQLAGVGSSAAPASPPSGPGPEPRASSALDDEPTLLRVARARARWHRALVEHDGDRAHPELRALGDELTRATVPLLEAPALGDDRALGLPPPRAQIEALLIELRADALGELLARGERSRALLAAYLRGHDDAAIASSAYDLSLEAATPPAGRVRRGLSDDAAFAAEMALYGRVHTLAMLDAAAAHDDLTEVDREVLCRAALALDPEGAAAGLAHTLLAHAPETARHTPRVGPLCAALFGSMRPARARALRWLAVPLGQPLELQERRWRLALVWALSSRAPGPAAAAFARLPPPMPSDLSSPSAYLRTVMLPADFVALTERLVPPSSELAQRVLRYAAQSVGRFPRTPTADVHAAWLSRLRARDPSLLFEAADALRSPEPPRASAVFAATVLTIGAGSRDANDTEVSSLLARVPVAGAQRPGGADGELSPSFALSARRALERTGACASDATCLAALLESDPLVAARAATLLGHAGLTGLADDAARRLVRRLLVAPDPWLLAAVLLSLRGCPAPFQGLVEAPSAMSDGPLQSALQPWILAHLRTCQRGAPR